MTVKKFYENIDGSYETVFSILSDDKMILHFIKRFKADETYAQLIKAVKQHNITESFENAHKLKGIAANLAFSKLYASLNELSEQLRPRTQTADKELVQRVSECYETIMREINRLEENGDVQ